MKKLLIIILFLISVPYLFSFGGGNGTSASPYRISTKAHLELLADSVNRISNWSRGKYFKVMNNITEPVTTVIGASPRYFLGNFDGQNYAITLAINRQRDDGVGLFGRLLDGATIKNVIVNGYVIGRNNVGGIVGGSNNSSITNCINNASVSGSGFVGGIVGRSVYRSSITNCMNIGNITGNGHVGGINGCGEGATITNCVNYGFVKGIDTGVGGINGHLDATIKNCINTGVVEGKNASVTGPIQGAH